MIKRNIIFILLLLYYATPTATSQGQGEQCQLGAGWEAVWRQCDCVPIASDTSLHVMCRQIPSATVPPLPHSENTQSAPPNIVALSMTEGALAFIQQDAFKQQNIQTLDFSHNHIQTVNVNAFRGLEMKLTQLNLRHNNLSVIPAWALTYLHQLQFLHLENNRITHIRPNTFDETQLNSLQFLHLDNNQLSVIPNLSFNRLRIIVLTLAGNRISELEKMSLPATLSFLDLRNNLLTQVPYLALKDLTALQTLNIEGNNISSLGYNPEVTFKSDIKLTLRNNKIRRLDENSFRSFRKLKELDLSYNQISVVYQTTFETVSQLRSLDLSYNNIVYIPHGTLKNFAKNLERLNLEENTMHTLPDALKDLHNLTHLNMNGNKLNKLNDDVLKGFKPTLTELLLAYNQLKEVPSQVLNGMQRLQHLDLSKNRIGTLERLAFGTFDGSGTSLVLLNLAGNHIRNISDPGVFLYMNTLAYLDLSYNRIEHIGPKAFEKLPALEKLFLQHNNLVSFPLSAFYKTQKLRHLVLDGNRIENLPPYLLGDLQRLEHLSLASNWIRHIDSKTFHASSARELKSLNLGGNRIETISPEAFANLENLQHLRLANNRIRTLPTGAFSNLKNLRHLDLSENSIVRILPQTFSNIPFLENVQLHHNSIEKMDNNCFYLINKIDVLILSYNNLKSIDCSYFGSLSFISQLDLSNNQISQLDLTCVKRGLQRLDLANNNLQSIRKETMQDFDQLTELSLSRNGILEIQSHALQTCIKLTSLDLSHNHIRTIWRGTFSHQTLISELDISHNALISVQRGSMGKNNILSLNLAGNELPRVPIDALETTSASLAQLDLGGNRLKSIDSPQLVGLRNVSSLGLSANLIDSVEEAAFEHLSSLRHLDLSHNPISSWSPTAFRDLSHSIVDVNLADTGLFSIPKLNHRAIRSLNISMNKIYQLTRRELAPISKVVTLDLSFNNMRTLDDDVFEDLVDMKHLNLSGNAITHLHEDHLKHLYQLESLHMHTMSALLRLPELHYFAYMNNLKELRLYDTPDDLRPYNVTTMLKRLPALRSLHIEIKENKLSRQLHNADKRLLRELVITGRNLQTIDVGAFYGLRGYRLHLSIRNTSIEEFPTAIFNTLTSVNYLSLSLANNKIRYINPFTHSVIPSVNQHGTILHSLRIEGNPLKCDCSLSWITDWITDSIIDPTEDLAVAYCNEQSETAADNSLAVQYAAKSPHSACSAKVVNTATGTNTVNPLVIMLIFTTTIYFLHCSNIGN